MRKRFAMTKYRDIRKMVIKVNDEPQDDAAFVSKVIAIARLITMETLISIYGVPLIGVRPVGNSSIELMKH
jgi:hypothetical protein